MICIYLFKKLGPDNPANHDMYFKKKVVIQRIREKKVNLCLNLCQMNTSSIKSS